MKILYLICAFFVFSLHAEDVIWSGNVHSDGRPTEPVSLELHKTYQIRVSGFVNLGKWVQNREKLANDACYEYNYEGEVEHVSTFRNSNEVSVCDGKYHLSHVYQSEPFVAKQNKIHFWLFDTDYEDNHGELKVEVLKIAVDKSLLAN